jgi:Zn-dependent protease/CBS domain-containing protein
MPYFSQIRLVRVFGIPIKLDMSWFIIFALLGWTLATMVFPSAFPADTFPDLTTADFWLMGIVSALLLFVSVLVHELCHCYVARSHGIPIRGITLFIFGGVSELVEEPPNPRAEFMMAGAGPLASIVICLLVGMLAKVVHNAHATVVVYGILWYLSWINGLLAVFNLVPGFPLDGGRLLRALLWKVTGNLREATRIASTVGSIFGLIFMGLGFLQIFLGHSIEQFISGLWLILIGFFVRNAALGSYQQLLLRRALQGVTVGQIMTANVVTVPADLPVSALVHDYFMRHRFSSFPVLDNGRLVGLVTFHEVRRLPRESWDTVTVRQIMDTHILALALNPNDSAMSAWVRMGSRGIGRVPVVEDGELVGILSQHDLVQFLNIMSDLHKD